MYPQRSNDVTKYIPGVTDVSRIDNYSLFYIITPQKSLIQLNRITLKLNHYHDIIDKQLYFYMSRSYYWLYPVLFSLVYADVASNGKYMEKSNILINL